MKKEHILMAGCLKRGIRVMAAMLLAAWVTACGYKLAGGGTLPAGVRTICVSIFENRSTETGMENQLTGDLIYEFTRNGQKVVSDPRGAQAVLTGVVKSVSVDTVSYTTSQTSIESRVTVVANVALKSVNGEEIWSVDGLVEKQAFSASRDDAQVAEQNKKDALALVSRRFAESVYARLTDDF